MNSAQPYEAYIFDCDGTLLDTDMLAMRAGHAALARLGVDMPLEWYLAAPITTLDQCRTRLRADYGIDLSWSAADVAAAEQVYREYWMANPDQIRATPVADTAATLAAEGLPLAIASANDGRIVEFALRVTGLAHLFSAVISRDDVRELKPAPDAYLLAAQALNVWPHDCLAFDNSDPGVQAARSAGMTVIDVRNPDWQRWMFAG